MLGERLKELRHNKGMTLRELSEKSGLSTGMLSQIENNSVDPSLTTLRKLAEVFEASVVSLFTEPNAPSVYISSKQHRTRLGSQTAEFMYERLTPGRGDLEMLKADIPPHHSSSQHAWAHPSTECAYVIQGEIVVEIDGKSHRITADQSVTFDSRLPHRYMNISEEFATIVLAVTPPNP